MKNSIIHASQQKVIGRFAPSPTGSMHFGTLISAAASFLFARAAGGRWLMRIEDLDPPRVVVGADREMLQLLEGLGFEWDGPVIYQSNRSSRYREILAQLQAAGRIFACNCTRREVLAGSLKVGEDGPVYPGTCRGGMRGKRPEHAIRLRVTGEVITFNDGIQGMYTQNLEQEVGDFVVRRADGLFAYQLAVVVDDLDFGVNQVVRGADLLSSTPRQIWLYRCNGAKPPVYFHHPLVVGEDGKKLSKSHKGYKPVTLDNGGQMLWQALVCLKQDPPEDLVFEAPPKILQWGLENFSPAQITPENRIIESD